MNRMELYAELICIRECLGAGMVVFAHTMKSDALAELLNECAGRLEEVAFAIHEESLA